MSVINQMLKDLEERTPDKSSDTNQIVAVTPKISSVKVVTITLLVILLLNGLGLYIWSLLEENQALKAKVVTAEITTKNEAQKAQSPQPPALTAEQMKPREHDKKREPNKRESSVDLKEAALSRSSTELASTEISESHVSAQKTQAAQIKVKQTKSQQTTIKPTTPIKELVEPPETKTAVTAKPQASMFVSSRQLTSKELVEQKIEKAEKAINDNNPAKAEALLEEVLILDAKQQQARKKLAALWFGRKSFSDAANLLSQGIALAPENSELRSMQAHIYLQQGKLTQAYNTLTPLDDLVEEEYQLLLVNISQQINEFDAAIKAYKILLTIQGHNSRWHLGLATVYDKTSQFSLAVSEYHLALQYKGLSQESSNFANQRIQALGAK